MNREFLVLLKVRRAPLARLLEHFRNPDILFFPSYNITLV
jgi:hypothetical protein